MAAAAVAPSSYIITSALKETGEIVPDRPHYLLGTAFYMNGSALFLSTTCGTRARRGIDTKELIRLLGGLPAKINVGSADVFVNAAFNERGCDTPGTINIGILFQYRLVVYGTAFVVEKNDSK